MNVFNENLPNLIKSLTGFSVGSMPGYENSLENLSMMIFSRRRTKISSYAGILHGLECRNSMSHMFAGAKLEEEFRGLLRDWK